MIHGKRGAFWDPKNQRFFQNRGLFNAAKRGAASSTWRTLMGHTNFHTSGGTGDVDSYDYTVWTYDTHRD